MNSLQHEKSLYLLQHKDNPVNWYPWGEEAFQKAKEENKPIFLSIGYATCHWCHVMNRESFEDKEIAQELNDNFVSIKVDREERPDIDSTYMVVCQMLNGQGGWPLNVIMTPEKEPFFAATYIPKEARFNRIGLRQLLPGIIGMWKHEPGRVRNAVESIKDGFSKSLEYKPGAFPTEEALNAATNQLLDSFDEENGGFGGAPKFPNPHNLIFLLRQWHHLKDDNIKNAVEKTLTEMRLGGIWDHIGFGFHRYSTDKKWLLPHFEKMLYDQALLMMAYTEGWQVTKNPLFKQTVEEIALFIQNEMTDNEGGFYSAQDADSEGEEGKFYVWNSDEVEQILEKNDADWFKKVFNFKDGGNFKDEATGSYTNTNIPHLLSELKGEDIGRFEQIRQALFNHRDKRIKPLLDDKILTDWNALMIAAFAKAGSVFRDKAYLQTAIKGFDFILKELFTSENLLHRYRNGEASINGFADDYAFLIWSALELYEATLNQEYLNHATKFTDVFIEKFWDNENGAFFMTKEHDGQTLGHQKHIFDGATPSANTVAMYNLLRLGRLTENVDLERKADQIGRYFSNELNQYGSSITMGMIALQFIHHNAKEIVISVGENGYEGFLDAIKSTYLPNKVMLLNKDIKTTAQSSFMSTLLPINNKTTVYICNNYSCDTPITESEVLKEKLTGL